MKSKGFIENTLLLLLLGLFSFALPTITKNLPTYTSQITQNLSKDSTRIADDEWERVYFHVNFNLVVIPNGLAYNDVIFTPGVGPDRGWIGSIINIDPSPSNTYTISQDADYLKVNLKGSNGFYASVATGNSWVSTFCPAPGLGNAKNGDTFTCNFTITLSCGGQNCSANQTCIQDINDNLSCVQNGSRGLGYSCKNGDLCRGDDCNTAVCDSDHECKQSPAYWYWHFCEKKAAAAPGSTDPDPETPNPPAAVPLPNPPTGTKAVAYCEGGKINADITFTPSSNASSHKVSYSFAANPLTNKYNPVNNAYTVDNISKNFKFNFTSYACNSAGNCIEDQNGSYSINVGDPCSTAGGTGGTAPESGTVKGTITVISNGVTYNAVSVKYPTSNGDNSSQGYSYNSSNAYSYSISTKTGTFNISAAATGTNSVVLKDSSETCAGTGGNEPFDCKINVKNGETVTQNFILTLSTNTPNPPSGSNAQIYCSGGKIQTDIKFTKSSNAAYHEVRYGVNSSNLSNTIHTTVASASIPDLTSGTKLSYTTYACSSKGECVGDKNGYYEVTINNPCASTGGNSGEGNAGSGDIKPGSGGVNETGVCAGKGGLDTSYVGYSAADPGYMGPRCGTPPSEDGKFDAIKAATKAFCGTTYSDAWKCKNGTAYSIYPNIDACTSSIAWCPTGTGNTGGGGNNGGAGGNTGTNPGTTAPKQGTFNAVVRVVPNGATYGKVDIAFRQPNGDYGSASQLKNGSNVYTFSVPALVGTFNASADVKNANGELIKDSAETCRGTGGLGPHDCKITVTEGATTTQNFTMSLDPKQTTPGGTTPIPTIPAGGSTQKQGVGEACTSENNICGGSGNNSCLKSKDGETLHCCKFTERFCEGLNRCVAGGSIEMQNCGRVYSTPTPTKIGAFNPGTCNGAPGSANNHCNGQNASGLTLSCCPGYHCNGSPMSATTACVKDSAAASSTQSVASESECSKNSDCRKLNKNACVLNSQEVGICK